MLRQSFRQSIRRIRGGDRSQEDVEQNSTRLFPVARSKVPPPELELAGAYSLSNLQAETVDPPDYATVIIEHQRSPSLASETLTTK